MRFGDREKNAIVHRDGAREQRCRMIVGDADAGAVAADGGAGRFSSHRVCIAGLRGDARRFRRAGTGRADAGVSHKDLAHAVVHLADIYL